MKKLSGIITKLININVIQANIFNFQQPFWIIARGLAVDFTFTNKLAKIKCNVPRAKLILCTEVKLIHWLPSGPQLIFINPKVAFSILFIIKGDKAIHDDKELINNSIA